MTEFAIDFIFKPEVLDSANNADVQVDQILNEIKGEIISSDNGNEAARLGSEELYRSEN